MSVINTSVSGICNLMLGNQLLWLHYIAKYDAVQLLDMSLGTVYILHWLQETKYLGAFLLSHKGLRVDIDSNITVSYGYLNMK